MPKLQTLGLDLPTFREIKAQKSVQFPQQGSNNQVVIFPTMNSLQDAILRAISPGSQPSDDPNLSALVAAGWNWLGLTLAEPDIQVKKGFLRKRDGKKRDDNVIETHPIYQLLAFDGRPNRRYSAPTLWKAFAYSWIIDGNGYILKFRNRFGQVVELWYEPHFTIRARWVNDRQGEYIPAERSKSVPVIPRDDNPNQDINYYELTRDGQRFRIEPADVIHFRDGIDPFNTRYGLSRMKFILREILGDSAAASYGASLLSGNGVIPYVLGIDDKEGVLNQEDLENIKAKLLKQTTGANAGQPMVLSSRMTFSRTGLTPAELDTRQTRYSAQEVFSAITGIPAIVLNFGAGMEHTIYNNMQQADRRAVDQYLQPLWWHIAQELTAQLLRDLDQDTSHFIEFDLSEVGALQEDENSRAERIVKLYEGGIIKRKEARAEFNYEVDDIADDVYFVKAGSETVSVEQEQAMRDQAMNPPAPQSLDAQQQPQQLALVKGRDARLLKGASMEIKEFFAAK